MTSHLAASQRSAWFSKLTDSIGRAIPGEFAADPEKARRAFFLVAFARMAVLFGGGFTIFYFLLGHYLGSGIVLSCTVLLALTPHVLKWSRSLDITSHYQVAIFAIGFTGLCFIEGGLHSHAIAWLATAPLIALLQVGILRSLPWFLFAALGMALYVVLELVGFDVPRTYPEEWSLLVASAGNVTLLIFFYVLGLAFEQARSNAQTQLESALGELASANQRLLQLNEEKNEFLGVAAHDLRNPLATIMMSAELLQMKPELGDSKHTQRILNEATRMRDLLNNLLDVNRIEEGRFDLQMEPVSVGETLAKILTDFEELAAHKGQKLLFVDESGGAMVRLDVRALRQIVENYVTNAIKYSPLDTEVRIRCLHDADCAMIEVTDQGPGMNEEQIQQLFAKFSKVGTEPTGGETSVGLGLSIVKRLAELMEGDVGCRSQPGQGATFYVSFPACNGEA